MAGWISRTLKRLSTPDAVRAVEPLPELRVRKAVESARRTMSEGDYAGARDALYPVVASNPDDTDVLANYGIAAHLAGDSDDARTVLLRAVQLDPNHLAANKGLAAACLALGKLQEFDVAARNALRLDPRDRELLGMYAIACMNSFQVESAAKALSASIELAPNDIVPLVNLEQLSVRTLRHRRTLERSPKIATARAQAINRLRAQYRRGQLDDQGRRHLLVLLAGSEETHASAVELARDMAKHNDFSSDLADRLSAIFLETGDLAQGLRFRRMMAEQDSSRPLVRRSLAFTELLAGYDHWLENWEALRREEYDSNLGAFAAEVPSWTGQRLGKKKILVYQEQGIGDAILALRLVPMLAARGVRCDLWVQPALAGLAGSIKGYENLIRSDKRPDARTLGCEYASTLFGLIPALRASHEELIRSPTVLLPSPDRVPAARARVRALPGRRIGLAYGGNPDRRDDWYRAVPPAALKPLAALEGISWVSIVFDPRPDKAEVIRMLRMEDPMEEAKDFEDTGAVISELDAVIAVDCSAAHLAASLGKPVWVLVPPLLDWRWQIGDDTKPWWPNATVLRSPRPGEWDDIIRQLAKQVATWIGN
jgi:Flp pilus assembly protein TadD